MSSRYRVCPGQHRCFPLGGQRVEHSLLEKTILDGFALCSAPLQTGGANQWKKGIVRPSGRPLAVPGRFFIEADDLILQEPLEGQSLHDVDDSDSYIPAVYKY